MITPLTEKQMCIGPERTVDGRRCIVGWSANILDADYNRTAQWIKYCQLTQEVFGEAETGYSHEGAVTPQDAADIANEIYRRMGLMECPPLSEERIANLRNKMENPDEYRTVADSI